MTTSTSTSTEFAALAAKIGNKAAKMEMARHQEVQASADAPEAKWLNAAKQWLGSMGMTTAAVVRQLQNPVMGFGLPVGVAQSVADEAAKTVEAEAAASALREAAEAPIRAEFEAAWKAAARMVTVYDEDGGTSQDLRVPADWTHDGCRTVGALLRKRGL